MSKPFILAPRHSLEELRHPEAQMIGSASTLAVNFNPLSTWTDFNCYPRAVEGFSDDRICGSAIGTQAALVSKTIAAFPLSNILASVSATIVEEKGTNTVRGPWCSPPVVSLEQRWIGAYQQASQPLVQQTLESEQRRHFLQQQRKSGIAKRQRLISGRRHNHHHSHHLNHEDEEHRRHHNNNNESPPDKKVMPMLLHPPPNLSAYTQPDSPQPLDFSVSGVSRYNGHVDLARISTAGSGTAGINGSRQSALQDSDMCSDQEYAGRTTSGSSSASNISDEGSPVHSPPVSPEPIQNREYFVILLYHERPGLEGTGYVRVDFWLAHLSARIFVSGGTCGSCLWGVG